jgi:hypothetical protein
MGWGETAAFCHYVEFYKNYGTHSSKPAIIQMHEVKEYCSVSIGWFQNSYTCNEFLLNLSFLLTVIAQNCNITNHIRTCCRI